MRGGILRTGVLAWDGITICSWSRRVHCAIPSGVYDNEWDNGSPGTQYVGNVGGTPCECHSKSIPTMIASKGQGYESSGTCSHWILSLRLN